MPYTMNTFSIDLENSGSSKRASKGIWGIGGYSTFRSSPDLVEFVVDIDGRVDASYKTWCPCVILMLQAHRDNNDLLVPRDPTQITLWSTSDGTTGTDMYSHEKETRMLADKSL